MDYIKLSKTISYALRHNPSAFNLDMDSRGWVELNQFITNLQSDKNCQGLTLKDIENILAKEKSEVKKSKKKIRYEISNGKIRALYGHNVNLGIEIEKVSSVPPAILYHGTTPEAYQKIFKDKIRHMDRQKVHLSLDIDIAIEVAKRRTNKPYILVVDCIAAYKNGIKFYKETTGIWLSDDIPAKFIKQVIK